MRVLLLVLLLFAFPASSQTDIKKRNENQSVKKKEINQKPTLGERGLNRLFLDGTMGFGFSNHFNGGFKYREYTFTSDFRMGNNFYLGKGERPMIIRLTYTRLGANFGNFGIFPYLVPPQIGLGKHFRIKPTVSIEPTLHFGYLLTSGDPYEGDIDPYGYFFMPEVKFNFSKFSIGIEYTMRKFASAKLPLTKYQRDYYFGFSLGRRIGRGL